MAPMSDELQAAIALWSAWSAAALHPLTALLTSGQATSPSKTPSAIESIR